MFESIITGLICVLGAVAGFYRAHNAERDCKRRWAKKGITDIDDVQAAITITKQRTASQMIAGFFIVLAIFRFLLAGILYHRQPAPHPTPQATAPSLLDMTEQERNDLFEEMHGVRPETLYRSKKRNQADHELEESSH